MVPHLSSCSFCAPFALARISETLRPGCPFHSAVSSTPSAGPVGFGRCHPPPLLISLGATVPPVGGRTRAGEADNDLGPRGTRPGVDLGVDARLDG